MPEGPEVRIMSDHFNDILVGKLVVTIECISQPYIEKYGTLVDELQSFFPLRIKPTFCVGKATFLELNKNYYFSYHLGMTGFWSLHKSKHAHLCLTTDKDLKFYFHDTRRFGNIKLISKSVFLQKFNPFGDLLQKNSDPKGYASFLYSNCKSNSEVCKILLNQNYFPGVGNYLKSEILYVSKIHPHRKWNDLSLKEVVELCLNTKLMLKKSYTSGGAQLRDFKNPKNSNDLHLLIYGREVTDKNEKVQSGITKDNRRSFWVDYW